MNNFLSENSLITFNLLMSLTAEERIPVIMTALDFSINELNLTIEDIIKLREEVIETVGEV